MIYRQRRILYVYHPVNISDFSLIPIYLLEYLYRTLLLSDEWHKPTTLDHNGFSLSTSDPRCAFPRGGDSPCKLTQMHRVAFQHPDHAYIQQQASFQGSTLSTYSQIRVLAWRHFSWLGIYRHIWKSTWEKSKGEIAEIWYHVWI